MSGTSLDGLDMALCQIDSVDGQVDASVVVAETVPYPHEWTERLSRLERSSAFEYALADVELGHYFGRCVEAFVRRHSVAVDLVASHGHTIFHQPHLGLTTQIGDADAMASECRLPVVSRFRNLDVALGGQGAPLVPIGDQLLFGNHDACLNLGGFSNISFCVSGRRVAFDVSPCNMALNHLSSLLGHPFDRNGQLAKSGTIDESLLRQMQALPYYSQPYPKSLGKEWFVDQFLPLISAAGRVEDRLRTVVEHIALQVADACRRGAVKTLLVTGGGAHNAFLVSRMQALAAGVAIEVPNPLVVDYKEALIFALLGYLRVVGQPNTLSTVTGASCDSIGGTISGILPPRP